MKHRATLLELLPAGIGLLALILATSLLSSPASSQPAQAAPMPAYDEEGRLLLPEDWRSWVFVGASLGLSYSEGTGGMEMFHETLLEPSAYEHFKETGEFRDGTMLVLLLHEIGENALPQRQGRFAGGLGGLEMAVKDSSRSSTWSYYGFGGRDGIRDRATAIGSSACNECHTEHAAHDNVFLQFYPLLAEVAPEGTVFASNGDRQAEEVVAAAATEPTVAAESSGPPLALDGLDPVLLTEGHAELGKAEIVAEHNGLEYRFVSEPTRARFAGDPERYGIQNDSCPVIPGVPVSPSLFAVHEARIYAFASQNCVDQFTAEPERYVPSSDGATASSP